MRTAIPRNDKTPEIDHSLHLLHAISLSLHRQETQLAEYHEWKIQNHQTQERSSELTGDSQTYSALAVVAFFPLYSSQCSNPEEARIPVPDARFDWLCELYKPASRVPAHLTCLDIAGLTAVRSLCEPSARQLTLPRERPLVPV